MACKYCYRTIPMVVLLVYLGGCSKSKPSQDSPKADLAVPSKTAGFAQNAHNPKAGKNIPGAANPLQQSIQEAASLDPPDDGELLPPEKTIAGKSVGKMFETIFGQGGVGGLWDQIHLATSDGKIIRYTANLITDLGTITIELWPEVAPNHVRNFIALAKVGYYDGLGFDLAVHQKMGAAYLDYLQAGCPLGTGEAGYGSIGYWLTPEFSDKIHEAGTIGACHGESLESAAAKFYITLGPAPWLDGNWTVFGKVIRGLDVARTIFQQPADADFCPKERVLIRQVTIQTP
jgi:peptidyl-prolyl cis-trans isomerase B (cyclophilin B)